MGKKIFGLLVQSRIKGGALLGRWRRVCALAGETEVEFRWFASHLGVGLVEDAEGEEEGEKNKIK